jgi:hypothetical protein
MNTQQEVSKKKNIKKVSNDITFSDEPEYYESMNEIAIFSKMTEDDKKKKQEDLERYYKNLYRYLHGNNKD